MWKFIVTWCVLNEIMLPNQKTPCYAQYFISIQQFKTILKWKIQTKKEQSMLVFT